MEDVCKYVDGVVRNATMETGRERVRITSFGLLFNKLQERCDDTFLLKYTPRYSSTML